jgi:hypothetical protein
VVRDFFIRKGGTKVVDELMKGRLVKQVEGFILSDDELDQMVLQPSHQEWGCSFLGGKRIEGGLMLASSHHKHQYISSK